MMRSGAIALAAFVVAIVAMMIVPLPTPLLDVLLTSNLAISVALLLVAVWSARTLELSTFPTLLLLTTLFRLALNVSSTRLILLQANAGDVIRAFGGFVVRGNYVVGARFVLDAMPGKQMAIDAEVRAGTLDGNEARRRRRLLSRESQFYGSMDG